MSVLLYKSLIRRKEVVRQTSNIIGMSLGPKYIQTEIAIPSREEIVSQFPAVYFPITTRLGSNRSGAKT